MENDAPTDAREQRRRAVSMLKRAASLPRMEGGRRPRMHTEAVSEGEKAADSREPTPDIDTPPPEPVDIPDEPVELSEPPPHNEPEEEEQTVVRPLSRSRRRSRSRRSKDLKHRSQATTPTHGDSSPELGVVTLDLNDAPALPPSPGPLNNLSPRQRMLRSPTPNGTDPLRSLSPSASPVLGMPSLEDIQRRGLLQRSHSTAGRQNAMAKLTGGQDVYDPAMSPSPTSGLRRNLTLSGGEQLTDERTLARRHLLNRLVPRIANKDSEGDLNSGEEQSTPVPPETRKKRRRSKSNKRRGSGSASNPAVSDSDYITTSPNTPILPASPLPQTPIPPDNPPYYLTNFPDARSPTPNYLLRSVSPHGSPMPNSPEPRPASPLYFSDQEGPTESSLPEWHSEVERPEPSRRRSIVVEEEEEEDMPSPFLPMRSHTPSQTSPLSGSPLRVPHSSNAPSTTSIDSNGLLGMPVYLSDTVSSRQDGFPTSLTQTPTRTRIRRDEEEEEVVFTGESVDYDREISWVALPVQEFDGDLNDEFAEERPPSSRLSLREDYEDRASVIIDSEPSPEIGPYHIPPSPSSVAALSQSASATRSNDSISRFPQRLSVADKSPMAVDYTDNEERPESSAAKRQVQGTWQKIKGFARSGSSVGRRSRTNSINARERRDYTDSSVSRESGASLQSGRVEKSDDSIFSMQQSQQFVTQSPAASVSVPVLSPSGQFSPTPMSASSSTGTGDYQRYQNPKLYPFPVLHQQLEQRRIAEGASSSTPDVSAVTRSNEDRPMSPLSPGNQTRELARSPIIGHQVSDTGMRIKYQNAPPPAIDYFNIPQGALEGDDSELPTTLPAVRRWMKVKHMFSSAPTSPDLAGKKPSLSDLLRIRKDTEVVTDKEGSTNGTIVPPHSPPQLVTPQYSSSLSPSSSLTRLASDIEQTPKVKRVLPLSESKDPLPVFNPATPSSPMSPTPDMSSASEYPAQTISSSSSSTTTSSNYSTDIGDRKAAIVLEKLEDNLARSSRSPMWANAIERPARELLLSSAVLQVVNANTVKDRFLFLFNDLLVVAKPATSHDGRPAADKAFVVKSVVMLDQLRFTGDRTDAQAKASSYAVPPRNPILRTFIHQFKRSPDQAISSLFSSLGCSDDPILLGQLLFRTTELDRAQLGDYLSRRTSKLVLRSYLDNFAFLGLRLDRALRAFLFSIHLTDRPSLDFLLDAFAIRWFDANAAIVAYNKSLAMNLVRAIIHLNEHLHDGLAVGPGRSSPVQGVHSRDFIGAFRQSTTNRGSRDSQALVSDDLLRDIFDAICRERLCMAVPTEDAQDLLNITIKRRLPEQLTYKVQSDPISIKLPHPDPYLTIHLYGQGLVFDPPVLSFAKSSEASFRVTGVSLGPKSFLMYRSGPNALRYTGLPLSSKTTVERAFMRNTFQLAFVNHLGLKRRYMFSLDDPIVKLNWTTELRRRCDDTASTRNSVASRLHRAIDAMAFRALQDTLLGRAHEGQGGHHGSQRVTGNGTLYSHSRSKSRSQVYHRQAGRNELDLSSSNEDQDDTDSGEDRKVWSWRNLVSHCQQNSSIGLFLSYLQIGSPGPELL